MERGATVTCVFEFPKDLNFSQIAAMGLYVRGVSSQVMIQKKMAENEVHVMENNQVRVDFSQEDTLKFSDGEDLRMQWHWRNADGRAKTSRVIETSIYEFLGSEQI